MLRLAFRFIGTALLASTALAGSVIEVPGDFDTVQDAIDAAVAGDVILVHGGTYTTIVIDKPLTIIGDPAPEFVNDNQLFSNPAVAPVTLAGPGSGVAVLVNVEVTGVVDGGRFGSTQAGIQGGGFRELQIFESSISGPWWSSLTGVAAGAPGIDVSVEFVLISGSSVEGSFSDNDSCYGGGPPGPPGIRAPRATVVLLDSTVRGGGSFQICGYHGCPYASGDGGVGVLASELQHADSTISGGPGADYYHHDRIAGTYTWCGRAPDGPALQVSSEVGFEASLNALSDLLAGRTWYLAWTSGPSLLALYIEGGSFSKGAPIWPDLSLSRASKVQAHPAGRTVYPLQVPPMLEMIGLRLTAQVHKIEGGVSRPVSGVVRAPEVRAQLSIR